jgi:hypothetical protein
MKGINSFGIYLLVSLLGIIFSCRTSNEIITKPSSFARTLNKANRHKEPLLMYSGVDTFVVTHLMVENRRRDITVQLDRLDSVRRAALLNTNGVQKKGVQLYMVDSTSYTLLEPHTIPLNKIARIGVVD